MFNPPNVLNFCLCITAIFMDFRKIGCKGTLFRITDQNFRELFSDFDFTTQHVARPHNVNDREIYCLAIKQWQEKKKQLDYSKLPAHLQTHKNTKSFLDRYSVVDPDGCSHTVVAHISKDGHYYIYPTPNPTIENVRSITVREAARLQSFPDDYYFEGSRGAAFKQIGNAVPVVLAYKIAEELKKQL